MLGDLIAVLLSPYDESDAFSGRIRVAVPRMGIGEQSATTLALVMHELATNSLKYGALSVASGMLDISGASSSDTVTITWTERGGPAVRPQKVEGYGSKLLQRSIGGQLGGTIETDWSADGVVVAIVMSVARLAT